MKKLRSLAIIVFAVTGLTLGAWAQDYPQDQPQPQDQNGPQGQDYPQGSNETQGQDYSQPQDQPQAQDYPQDQGGPGPSAPEPGGPSLGSGTTTRSNGPAPSVARISLIKGDVSMARGDTGEWASTTINAPLVQGDQILTGEKARTEIQLDYADLLRLAAHSQVKLADLSGRRIQVQVSQGYTSLTMLKGGEADVEIDSPNVAVHPLKAGRYRVQVNSDSETDVIVRQGEAEISTPQGSTRVHEGEMIVIRGTDQPEYKVSSAPDNDDWDQWNKDRDRVVGDSQSVSRTSRYYTGVNDLDSNGRWIYVPGYGNVWQPYQEATWAPYQAGRWVYEPYYGWTWVSYEPWGWAPYHYGRWFYYGDNWCWWPGPAYVGYRPLWSPAFVFFVGFGHRAGFGFGSIGWFPVGPHDPFYPWYGRGFGRVNVVNITNITVINRGGRGEFIAPLAIRGRQPFFSNANLALTNPRVRGSITSVSADHFGRGNEGLRHGVEEHELRGSSVMTGNLPVVPTHESLQAGRGGSVPAGVQPRNNAHFYTNHQPPAGPESFHTQVQRVQRVVGSEAGGGVNARSGGNGGVNARTGNAQIPRTGGNTPGMGPKDSPARMAPGINEGMTQNHSSGNNGSTGNASGNGGWNKFGSPAGRSEAGGGRSESSPGNNNHATPGGPAMDRQSESHTQQNGGGNGGNWQRFPSNSGASAQGGRSDQGSGSKPPLELHRPVVTQREGNGSSSPTPRGESGYNPPAPRNDSRGSAPIPHSESSRGSGNSGRGSYHGGGGGSSSRGGGGGSSSRGGGSSSHGGDGGHSESKSSSGSKH